MVHTIKCKTICDICIEASSRYLECNVCNLIFCSTCFIRHQMDSSKDEIQCMKCSKTFEDEYLFNRLPKRILNNLKNRKKDLLFQKEKTFFPQTQYLAKFDKQINTLILPTISNIESDLIQIERCMVESNYDKRINLRIKHKGMVRSLYFLKTFANSWKTKFTVYNPVGGFQKIISHYVDSKQYELIWDCIPREIKCNGYLFNRNLRYLRNDSIKDETKQRFEHVLSCNESNCKGFVMKSDWACGICNTQYCKKCFHKVHINHVCSQENIDSAAFILKTSKACPKCATRIHKISGCDQMFCTHCNTAFSWNTLEIETGVVHNPHFFEWQNRTEYTLADECNDNRIDIVRLVRHCEKLYGFSFSSTLNSKNIDNLDCNTYSNIRFLSYLLVVYRLALHIEAVEINRRFHNNDESQSFNMDLRIKYLNNDIDENHYKKILHKRFKSRRVNIRRTQILNLYVVVCTDILRRFLENNNNSVSLQDQLYTEFFKLFEYIHECFVTLCNIYDMNMPVVQITETDSLNPRYIWTFAQDKFTGALTMKKYPKIK